jgi:hypothetical protein
MAKQMKNQKTNKFWIFQKKHTKEAKNKENNCKG